MYLQVHKLRTRKTIPGFTLIELLVVISIIAMLGTIIAGPIQAARKKGRDAKRMQDLHAIRNALETYQINYGYLPSTASYGETNQGGWDSSAENGFLTFLSTSGIMPRVPKDPRNIGTADASDAYLYKYYCYSDGTVALLAYLEYPTRNQFAELAWAPGYTCQ